MPEPDLPADASPAAVEAARKQALLAPSTTAVPTDDAARKRQLLRSPDAAPEPQPATPTRADVLRATVRSRLAPYTRRQLAALTACAVLVLGIFTYGLTRPPAPVPLTSKDVAEQVAKGIEAERKAQAAKPPEGEAVYAAVRPSLVVIRTNTGGEARSEGLGAGTLVKDDGTILTALHVVAGASTINVRFADGTEARGSIANVDAVHDIAVLTVDRLPDLVVPAVLGGGVRVGDPVYALGHPLGLGASFSGGVVSATGRTLTPKGGTTLKDLIQFDAAVNPGNSGGPLINRRGEVVGVVTALVNPSDQAYFIGLGFAAPITSAGGAAGAPPQ